MKILFILNQLPYPPRNGVTIPTYNFLKGLSEFSGVSLLFLRDPLHEYSEDGIEQNRMLVEKLWIMDVTKKPKIQRIWRELKGESFFHIGREYDMELVARIFSQHEFDVIWISDDGILDVVEVLREFSRNNFKAVAGLNDCITAVFKQSKKYIFLKGVKLKERILFFIKWVRSFHAGTIEKRILGHYDLVLVQSDSDRKYLNRISRQRLDSRIMILPNGVEARLFQNKFNAGSKELVFVGSLRGYSRIVEWLLAEVWPSVKLTHPTAVFRIIGRGASNALLSKMANQSGISYTEYVADISDVYKDKAVSISPVFKDYGLINKVIESMAAGIPVVADKGSFGCIPEFTDGKHGLVANDAAAMVDAVNMLLSSAELRANLGRHARDLVRRHFNWANRVEEVYSRIASPNQGDNVSSV